MIGDELTHLFLCAGLGDFDLDLLFDLERERLLLLLLLLLLLFDRDLPRKTHTREG